MEEGRPRRRRWNSDHYPKAITLRVTAAEHEALMRRALLARMSASRYLTAAGLRGKAPPLRETLPPNPRQRQELETLLYELRKVGVNLNQLARQQHRARLLGRKGPAPDTVERAAKAVEVLIRLLRERL